MSSSTCWWPRILKTVRRSHPTVPRRQHPVTRASTCWAALSMPAQQWGTYSCTVGWRSLGATTLQPSRLRTRCPTAHGVDRDHRPAEFEDTEQGRNSRDLVGLAADGPIRTPTLGRACPPRPGRRWTSCCCSVSRLPHPSPRQSARGSAGIRSVSLATAISSGGEMNPTLPLDPTMPKSRAPSSHLALGQVGPTPGQTSCAQCQEPPLRLDLRRLRIEPQLRDWIIVSRYRRTNGAPTASSRRGAAVAPGTPWS